MQSSTLQIILEYVWIPIMTGLVMLWSKLAGIDVRTRLLEQADRHWKQQRAEEKKLRDEQRKEILTEVRHHHSKVMDKLDQVETRVKNGH